MTQKKIVSKMTRIFAKLYWFFVSLLLAESLLSGLIILYSHDLDNSYEQLIFLKLLFPYSDTIYRHIVLGSVLVLSILPLIFSFLLRTKKLPVFPKIMKLIFLLFLFLTAVSGFLMVGGGTFYFLPADKISGLHFVFSVLASVWALVLLVLFLISSFVEETQEAEIKKTFDKKVSAGQIRNTVVLLLVILIFGLFIDSLVAPTRLISKIQNRRVFVDGRVSDIEWMGVDEISVAVQGGANQAGQKTVVRVKSFNNGKLIYFLLRWKDETRSLNRHLRKTKGGWIEIKSDKWSSYGETVFSEDQMALSFHKSTNGCLKSCHIDSEVSAGRHYTDGDTVDVWFWKAVSSNVAREAVDGWWGELTDDISGGVHVDNRAGGGAQSNLNEEWQEPYFLPKYYFVKSVIKILSNTYIPYSVEADKFPVGKEIPAVAVSPSIGDVSDVRAVGTFRGGEWTVEISRRLTTGSPFDLPLRDTLYMGIAIFDNAQKHHAYHLKPVQLIIER